MYLCVGRQWPFLFCMAPPPPPLHLLPRGSPTYLHPRLPLSLIPHIPPFHTRLQEKDLQEIVQLVGRDSLSEDQKVVLEIAKIIREDYLQQNAFSEHDYNCPVQKSVGMLRAIVTLYNRCMKAVTGSDTVGKTAAVAEGASTMTWNSIKASAGEVVYSTTQMKFLDPRTPSQDMANYFQKVVDNINNRFDELAE